MNELALFAGAGGGILGGRLLGWTTVAAVEIEQYPREVLLARQRDGFLPEFPIWDDVRSFNGKPWRGLVDVISGGFPCQDISPAGKRAGIDGERSGLWSEMHRIISEVRPRYVLVENSSALTSRGLGRVLGDLAEIGYHAAWMCLSAVDCGAPHKRERMWILAADPEQCGLLSHADLQRAGWGQQLPQGSPQADAASHADTDRVQRAQHGSEHKRPEVVAGGCTDGLEPRGAVAAAQDMAHADGVGRHAEQFEARKPQAALGASPEQQPSGTGSRGGACEESAGWWTVEPRLGRVAHGVAHRVDRIKAIGNGQVSIVAAVAFRHLEKVLLKGGCNG